MTQEEFFKRYTYSPSRDRIGGGGFGTVYKAKDNLLHRTVAIKVSEVKTTADGKKPFSLKDEFEALNHVPKHPNIANYEELYSFEDHRGLCDYAVMQYYPDGNLSNAIKQGLTIGQKDDIATQLLEGIAFLHQHKVVHRDLKPSNILIVKDGDKVIPLITDFGLSKAAGVVDGSVFSNSFGAGTPRYSSPEQLQGQPLRFNTDLWSYGTILYELFTGEQLFSAGSGAANTAQADMEVYNKIVNGNVQSLGKMPEKWRKVAERCLVVDSANRAKDAGELFAIIKGNDDETIVSSSGSGTTMGPKMPTNTSPIDRPSPQDPDSLSPTPNDKPGNKKGLWIGLGITAAVIVALLLLLKPKQEPTPALEAQVAQSSGIGNANGHEYVDLSLPSGTLWATCNVGASKPEDYGSHFAWDETSTKSTYNWETYKYANGAYDKLTKYCNKSDFGDNGFTDNLTSLQVGDDPATVKWGSGWRTPSKVQWEELLNNTNSKWTMQSGKAGYLFTSKKNGQSVFLPAAGCRWDSEYGHTGSIGTYWVRSLNTADPPLAQFFYFNNSDGCDAEGFGDRYHGFNVRPVREK